MADPAQRFFEAEKLRAAGDLGRAEAAYRALLEDQPRHVGGFEGMAATCLAAGRSAEADIFTAQAAAIRADAAADVAAALLFHNDMKRARQCCEQALSHNDNCLKAHWLLGDIEARADNRDAALAHYRRCREIAPERLGPGFLMAALGEGTLPERAPADYVTAQFDWYAETFDAHLVETLLYRGPEEVARALRPELGKGVSTLLDLGCGTGLLAPELGNFSGRLIGVDLSPAMLEKAAGRGRYDALEAADIVEFLATWPAGTADIAAAVDVVVYIGDLGPLMAGVARALRPGGVFVFTTERWNADEQPGPTEDDAAVPGWRLRSSGRFQHARSALSGLAGAHGFSIESIEDRVLRYEYGLPVDSDLVKLRRQA
jgi:predicted TPR repeat methyltransferase